MLSENVLSICTLGGCGPFPPFSDDDLPSHTAVSFVSDGFSEFWGVVMVGRGQGQVKNLSHFIDFQRMLIVDGGVHFQWQ